MNPEARLFAMTAILLFAGVACFGLAHFAVWRQRHLQEAAEREAQRAPEPQPPPVSSVSVETTPLALPDAQTDGQTDYVSALSAVTERLRVDRSRSVIIDTLLLAGWTASEIRPHLRGDNNTISAEIAEARKRLHMAAERREIPVREHVNGERVERTISL